MSLAYHDPHSHHVDATQQLRTYHGVLIGIRYVVLHFIVIVSFLVLALATPVGWIGAFVIAAIELAVGLWFAKDRKEVSWPSEFATLFITTSAESGHPVEDQIAEEARAAQAQARWPQT
jgi:hypothetical protein